MKFFCIFTLAVLIITMLCGFIPSRSDMELYDNVVRLHVIANSDNEHDQKTKLLMRDAVLKEMDTLASSAQSAEEAASMISSRIGEISEAVNATLSSLGEKCGARVTLSRESYPTKDYGDIALPSGEYLSLKIIIGDGNGQNWWCMLYPAVCLSPSRASDVLKQTGFTPNQIKILTEDEKPVYKIKFKLLELMSAFS